MLAITQEEIGEEAERGRKIHEFYRKVLESVPEDFKEFTHSELVDYIFEALYMGFHKKDT